MLTALPYYGGKSRLGPWVLRHLPYSYDAPYVEPFGGMLGVLLQRRPARIEVAGDRNPDLINWWECVRSDWRELKRLVAHTPHSRKVLDDALTAFQTPAARSSLDRALLYHILMTQSMEANAYDKSLTLLRYRAPVVYGDRLEALAERVRNVQFLVVDAVELLDHFRGRADAIIYCDPPYKTTENKRYGPGHTVDYHWLTQALIAQRGRVAISGYDDEWDSLGWRKVQTEKAVGIIHKRDVKKGKPRIESLWLNFDPPKDGFF